MSTRLTLVLTDPWLERMEPQMRRWYFNFSLQLGDLCSSNNNNLRNKNRKARKFLLEDLSAVFLTGITQLVAMLSKEDQPFIEAIASVKELQAQPLQQQWHWGTTLRTRTVSRKIKTLKRKMRSLMKMKVIWVVSYWARSKKKRNRPQVKSKRKLKKSGTLTTLRLMLSTNQGSQKEHSLSQILSYQARALQSLESRRGKNKGNFLLLKSQWRRSVLGWIRKKKILHLLRSKIVTSQL